MWCLVWTGCSFSLHPIMYFPPSQGLCDVVLCWTPALSPHVQFSMSASYSVWSSCCQSVSGLSSWLSLNSPLSWFMTVIFPRICLYIRRLFTIAVIYLIWGRRLYGFLLSSFHYWAGTSSFWEDYRHCGQSWTGVKLRIKIIEYTSLLGSRHLPHLTGKL